MARKTKQLAQLTRSGLLDAAERLFQAQGVSGTSLQAIAQEAGFTRGAVYWHFKDKADIVNAMIDRVCLPMEDDMVQLAPGASVQNGKGSAGGAGGGTLAAVMAQAMAILKRVRHDPQARRLLEIATHKMEQVPELGAVLQRRRKARNDFRAILERSLRTGQRRGEVAASPSARQMAIGLHALLDGLLGNWIIDPQAFDLLRAGRATVGVYLAGLARP